MSAEVHHRHIGFGRLLIPELNETSQPHAIHIYMLSDAEKVIEGISVRGPVTTER